MDVGLFHGILTKAHHSPTHRLWCGKIYSSGRLPLVLSPSVPPWYCVFSKAKTNASVQSFHAIWNISLVQPFSPSSQLRLCSCVSIAVLGNLGFCQEPAFGVHKAVSHVTLGVISLWRENTWVHGASVTGQELFFVPWNYVILGFGSTRRFFQTNQSTY